MTINNSSSDQSPTATTTKKPYEKPFGVDHAMHVLPGAVVDGAVRLRQRAVGNVIVMRDQLDLVRDGLAEETHDGLVVDAADHASDDAALALDGANDGGLALDAPALVVAVVRPMPVLALSADISFIELRTRNFNSQTNIPAAEFIQDEFRLVPKDSHQVVRMACVKKFRYLSTLWIIVIVSAVSCPWARWTGHRKRCN